MTLALIDADIVAFRCAASAEHDPQGIAEFRVNDLMQRILHETNSSNYIGYLTGSNNFRYEIYPEYKANRKDKPRPKHLEACKELLIKEWKCKVTDGIEADDALGIDHQAEPDSILASIDKDLLQLPGAHYNFVKQTFVHITPLDGIRNFYSQVIEGDATDNVPAWDGKFRSKRPKFVEKLLDSLYYMDNEWDMYCYAMSIWCENENQVDLMHRNAHLLYIHKKEGDRWQIPILNSTMGDGHPDDLEALLQVSSVAEQEDGHPSMTL